MLFSPLRSVKTDRSPDSGYTGQSRDEVVDVNDDRSDAGLVKVRRKENCLKEKGNSLNRLFEFGEPKYNDHL